MGSLRLYKVVRQPTAERAERRAARLWPRHRGFQGAYMKGWRAKRGGRGAGACPYDKLLQGWTWAWRSAWFQGWYEGSTG